MDGERQPYSVKYYREIKAKKVEWLWYPYIPYGKITIMQGDPGEGKSTVAINLASEQSRGNSSDYESACTNGTAEEVRHHYDRT